MLSARNGWIGYKVNYLPTGSLPCLVTFKSKLTFYDLAGELV